MSEQLTAKRIIELLDSEAASNMRGFALLGTTEWPGFDSPDLELADPMKLVAAYPTLRPRDRRIHQDSGRRECLRSRRKTIYEPARRHDETVRRLRYPNTDHPTRDRRLKQLRRV